MLARAWYSNEEWDKLPEHERQYAEVRASRVVTAWQEREALAEKTIQFDDFELHQHVLLRRGEVVPLTRNQFRLAKYLILNYGKLISYRTILLDVWGPGYVTNIQILRVCVSDCRKLGVPILTGERIGYSIGGNQHAEEMP